MDVEIIVGSPEQQQDGPKQDGGKKLIKLCNLLTRLTLGLVQFDIKTGQQQALEHFEKQEEFQQQQHQEEFQQQQHQEGFQQQQQQQNDFDDYFGNHDFWTQVPHPNLGGGGEQTHQQSPDLNQGLGQQSPGLNQGFGQQSPGLDQGFGQPSPGMNQGFGQLGYGQSGIVTCFCDYYIYITSHMQGS